MPIHERNTSPNKAMDGKEQEAITTILLLKGRSEDQ
jgi:hypothetical protein